MSRGNSCGGGQSQLGYLLGGGGEASAPKPAAPKPAASEENNGPPGKTTAIATAAAPPSADITKQVPAGVNSTSVNNYMRADGQNTGNFLTERPSTRVHAAPGGGSSLDYLFNGNK